MHGVTGLADEPPHGGYCRGGAALRQPQECQPRLGFVPECAGRLVRRRRADKVATETQHVTAFGHD